ncbi:MAG: hypothetical protein D6769_01145 [Methanobacteriota archaeon]|nr:MAG: hypothetical protein D6769_01145 [Euryarchaeota archaeon]
MEEEFEELYSANSELRYITLELMKIATKRGVAFEEVCKEFLGNVNELHRAIEKRSRKRGASGRLDG